MGSGKHLHSFTTGEKLNMIEEGKIGNCAAGQKYDLPESYVRDWRRKKDKLLTSSKDRQAFPPYILINYL
jgi:hypothetical protein